MLIYNRETEHVRFPIVLRPLMGPHDLDVSSGVVQRMHISSAIP